MQNDLSSHLPQLAHRTTIHATFPNSKAFNIACKNSKRNMGLLIALIHHNLYLNYQKLFLYMPYMKLYY